ncbi:diguanylate cyclase domain protein [Clostridiales bacterium oral taxon 876 str. F0540]|nr:diguanylate cyclase domain protein [Clostridiales bacterium oral taxon 876 str. F0540]
MGYEGTVEEYELRASSYEELKKEFENYKRFTNSTMEIITKKNLMLEKKLDSISNIVEISKYINSNISNDNLIPMINDMIIGILGVTYSSIYLKEDDKLQLKATNITNEGFDIYHKEYGSKIENGEPFVVSCEQDSFCKSCGRINIHSVIGVPVVLGQKYIGYIIVEHGIQDFFSNDHIKFITSIANQIAIALENSMLYKKVKESSIKDSLLKIYNRGYFFELVEDKIKKSPHKNFAIVMVDADDFKKANDVYGHQFGDEALCQIAKIISENIDKSDIVARYGGEEIIIYIDDVHDRDMVFDKVENIRKKISDNIICNNNNEIGVTASFGISYYDEERRDLKEVLKLADLMMYSAKNSGKNVVISV